MRNTILASVLLSALIGAGYLGYRQVMRSQLKQQLLLFVPADRADGKIKMHVNFQVEPARCFLGDVDYMNYRARLTQQTHIILTIEPLSRGIGLKKYHESISLKELSNGSLKKSLMFDDPGQASALYGVYLCQDGQGRKTCQGKRPSDIDEFFRWHFKDPKKAYDSSKKDVIYYFQPVFVTSQGIALLSEARGGNRDQFYDKFQTYLISEIGWSASEAKKGVEALRKALELVGSVPAKLIDGQIKLSLPRLDTTSCQIELIEALY